MHQPVRTAVFPVAGLGTRFLPATKALPKEMLPVVDTPLIEYAVEEARAAGIEEFIFVTGRGKSAIEDHFDRNFELEGELERRDPDSKALELVRGSAPTAGHIAYVRQGEPLGPGHAVWCARRFVGNEPFAVLLADDLIMADPPTLVDLMEVYEDKGGNVISLMEIDPAVTSRYGVISPGHDDGRVVEILDLVEKPPAAEAPSNLAIVGRYILQPGVMEILARGAKGAGGEIQLTDGLAGMVGSHPFHGVRLGGTRFDCGTKIGFLEANVAYALGRPDLEDDTRARLRAVLDRF